MITSLTQTELTALVGAQLSYRFPVGPRCDEALLGRCISETLAWAEHCFAAVAIKYFHRDGQPFFDHLHGDQYAMFLYRLSRALYLAGDAQGAAMVYQLNKTYFGIDAFYEVALPDLFLFVHPLGTVLGRGEYGNGLVVYQGVSVGDHLGEKPRIGKWCVLHPKSTVLGAAVLGNHVRIGASAMVIGRAVPQGTVLTGNPRSYTLSENRHQNPYWKKETIDE